MAQVNIQIDDRLNEEGSRLFEKLGISFSNAVSMFISQAIREQGIPLKPTLKNLSQKDTVEDSKKNLLDLFGDVKFAEGYDYKAFREGRQIDTGRYVSDN